MAAITSAAGIVTGVLATLAVATAVAQPPCPGDCNGDRRVSIDELVTGVALVLSPGSRDCPAMDGDQDGTVVISELVSAVGVALDGCGEPSRFAIDGCVNEFPGEPCGAFFESVLLQPLGITQPLGSDRQFHFENLPPGTYTLSVVQGCNPFGCWPSVAVTVADQDVFVHMDLNPAPTPTSTPTPIACGDEEKVRRFAQCAKAKTESDCVSAGGRWGPYPYSRRPGCFCDTGQRGCPCSARTDCLGQCYAPFDRQNNCDQVERGSCSGEVPIAGCFCAFDSRGQAWGLCIDP